MFDIMITGAGCAGLTAAIYSARAGKKVLVLEGESIGGQISVSPRVENYPGIKNISGMEFSDNLFEQASSFGVQFEFAAVKEVQVANGIITLATDYGSFQGKRLILATGVKHKKLGLENEERLTGEGVSYCSTCDGAFYAGKNVAVVGGGSSALLSALSLAEICSRVFLIHRRGEFRGEAALINEVCQNKKIELVLNSVTEKILGKEKLEAIAVKNTQTGEERLLEPECLFVNIGKVPSNEIFKELVELDEEGYIVAGEDCRTANEFIFAAGDCRTKEVRQLTTAAADGTTAALAASR